MKKALMYALAGDVVLQVKVTIKPAARTEHARALALLERLTDSGSYSADGPRVLVRGRRTAAGHVPTATLTGMDGRLQWTAEVNGGLTVTTFTVTGSACAVTTRPA